MKIIKKTQLKQINNGISKMKRRDPNDSDISTCKQLFDRYKKDFIVLLNKGYKNTDIYHLISDTGIKISPMTVNSHLARIQKEENAET